MAKGIKKLLGLAVAAAGVYAVGKYLHDYTDYKLAEKDDLDELKDGGERAKDAAKRTYIAIRSGQDVNAPAGELGAAVAEVAGGAGKFVTAVGENTKKFALNEKEKYTEDPAAFRAKVAENIRDMGQQAAGIFSGLKEDAEQIITDIKETKDGLKSNEDDFADSFVEEEKAGTAEENSFTEVIEENLYDVEPGKQYADITPPEQKAEGNTESAGEMKAEETVVEESGAEIAEKEETVTKAEVSDKKKKAAVKSGKNTKEADIVVSVDTVEIR